MERKMTEYTTDIYLFQRGPEHPLQSARLGKGEVRTPKCCFSEHEDMRVLVGT